MSEREESSMEVQQPSISIRYSSDNGIIGLSDTEVDCFEVYHTDEGRIHISGETGGENCSWAAIEMDPEHAVDLIRVLEALVDMLNSDEIDGSETRSWRVPLDD